MTEEAKMRQKIEASDKIKGRPIRLNKKTLKLEGKSASVLLLGDIHWGSPQCDKKRLRENINWCLNHHVYVLLMGDLLESSTRTSIGAGVYEQEGTAQDQMEEMEELLEPLAAANLILGTLNGNHEARIYETSGVNIAKAMARSLRVPYLGDACWNLFEVGSQRYTVYALHGRTAAQYDGTVLKAVENISHSFNADVVAMGHAHKAVNGVMLIQSIVNGCVIERKKFIVVTGSYLKYDGGYWQTKGGRLAKLGSPLVKFYSDRHDLLISW
jgi:predicted phosphodiesterase